MMTQHPPARSADAHEFEVMTAFGDELGSPARLEPATRPPLRIGVVQTSWHPDANEHRATLAEGVRIAASAGAKLVCLQELTLSPYFATVPDNPDAKRYVEDIPDGPTTAFAIDLAREHDVLVHASLYERNDTGLGYNTAICVSPAGVVHARTRKMHIPAFPGYHEDYYFDPGDSGFPVVDVAGAHFGFPTCWDQWFPELARSYSLKGAEVLVYPTAIGNEPHLGAFDTEPLWQHMITANGLANATFMVVINRIGTEDGLAFYGSSFISDPYGRVIVKAPRDRDTVLVADLDLDRRRDWLTFGLLDTRRPSAYTALTAPTNDET